MLLCTGVMPHPRESWLEAAERARERENRERERERERARACERERETEYKHTHTHTHTQVLNLEGKLKAQWAPDSGMLEAAISQELTDLSRPRDIAEILAPLEPLIPALGVDPPDIFPGVNPASDVIQIEVSEEAVSVAAELLPLSRRQPVISVWLHWGCQSRSDTAADLDLSAVALLSKGLGFRV